MNRNLEQTETASQGIARRLGVFFSERQLSTYRVSQQLGYGKSTKLNKILSGDTAPSIPTLIEIATVYPELSLDWIVLGRTAAIPAPAPEADSRPRPFHAVGSGRVLAVTVDRTGTENILHIPARAQAGYSHSFDEPAYLRDLTPYSLPLFTSGSYRSFEVEGDSMSPTFGHRDTVICQAVDRWDMLAPGHCYVVVVDGNVLVKRLPCAITGKREVVELVSDNRAYPVHKINAADIIEVWHVRAVLSTNIPASSREVQERTAELLEALGADQKETRRLLASLAPIHAPSA